MPTARPYGPSVGIERVALRQIPDGADCWDMSLEKAAGNRVARAAIASTVKKQLASLLCALCFRAPSPTACPISEMSAPPSCRRKPSGASASRRWAIRWREAAYLDDVGGRGAISTASASGSWPRLPRVASISAFCGERPDTQCLRAAGRVHRRSYRPGPLQRARNPELASVLGHEIAHVTQRHIARMIGNQGVPEW